MKEEFIILNKTAIQKRIEELERLYKSCEKPSIQGTLHNKLIVELKQILSQSTPLIPVLEDCYESGVDSLQDNLIQKLGLRYQTNEVSSTTINSTRGDLKEYILNLKLDI